LGVKTKTQLMAEKSVFKTLLAAAIAAPADPMLLDPTDEFTSDVCRHFAMLFHSDSSSTPSSSSPITGQQLVPHSRHRGSTVTNLKELDPTIFLDAIVEVLCSENRAHAKAALNALNTFAETLLFLARVKHSGLVRGGAGPSTPMLVSSPSINPVYSPPPSVRVPVFEQLLPRLLHCCYGATWQAQIGGVMGLGALVGKVSVEILCAFQVRMPTCLIHFYVKWI
jgi:transformation/transcription domain-associated protein